VTRLERWDVLVRVESDLPQQISFVGWQVGGVFGVTDRPTDHIASHHIKPRVFFKLQ
jgi:hypothetical protein